MKITEGLTQNHGKARQFIAAVTVNLVCLAYGLSVGWISPMIPQLQSTKSPIGNAPMSKEQISWLNSLLPIGGLFTIPFCGILSERIGRKKFAILTAFPLIVSWLLVIFAQNFIYLFVARFFVGITGAMTFFIVPIYVSEIACEYIRGILGSFLIFSLSIGIVLAYVAGEYLSYLIFAIISLIFPIIFLATFAFMPESPIYLVRCNLQIQAKKSLMFFRDDNEDVVKQELIKLRSQTNATDYDKSNTIKWSYFLTDRATRKALIISMGLITGQQLSGIFAMISYTETIFKLTGSDISSNLSSIIIGGFQIVGAYVSTTLMDRSGRRILTLTSCLGMAISHFLVGLFFYLQKHHHNVNSISWLPVIGLSAYIIFYNSGMGPVPFVITSEIFRLNVNSFASTLCFTFYWGITFASIQTFDKAMLFLGSDGCFFMLACFCLVTLIFAYFMLPETKGREREDIINELAGIKSQFGDEEIVVNC